MKQHVNKVVRACFYHLRRMKLICRLLGPCVAASLVSACVLSRLDYCNAVLAGLSKSTIAPLQHIENAATRLVWHLATISLLHCVNSVGLLFNNGLRIICVLCTLSYLVDGVMATQDLGFCSCLCSVNSR